jgi:hypothetical protein
MGFRAAALPLFEGRLSFICNLRCRRGASCLYPSTIRVAYAKVALPKVSQLIELQRHDLDVTLP